VKSKKLCFHVLNLSVQGVQPPAEMILPDMNVPIDMDQIEEVIILLNNWYYLKQSILMRC